MELVTLNMHMILQGATIDNVLYPSIDPMIFEVKFPNSDIKGKIVNI
jgi:hypothetical protein